MKRLRITTRRIARAFEPTSRLLLALAMVISAAALVRADAVASVDRSEVQIADPFIYQVTLTAPAGSTVTFPELTETLGSFVVLSTNDAFDVPEQFGRRWTRTYQLESYESGDLTIPAMQIVVGQSMVTTNSLTVSVQSQLGAKSDPAKFRDLKEIEEIPNDQSYTPWLVGAGAFLLAAVVGWWFVRKRKSTPSPEQWVASKLEELQSSHGYHSKNPTIVLPQAADILREYIRQRFAIEAPRQTTDEFLSSLHHNHQLSENHREELRGFLQHVDKIKFSNLVPSKDEVDETIEHVRQFVAQTSNAQPRPTQQNTNAVPSSSGDRLETT